MNEESGSDWDSMSEAPKPMPMPKPILEPRQKKPKRQPKVVVIKEEESDDDDFQRGRDQVEKIRRMKMRKKLPLNEAVLNKGGHTLEQKKAVSHDSSSNDDDADGKNKGMENLAFNKEDSFSIEEKCDNSKDSSKEEQQQKYYNKPKAEEKIPIFVFNQPSER